MLRQLADFFVPPPADAEEERRVVSALRFVLKTSIAIWVGLVCFYYFAQGKVDGTIKVGIPLIIFMGFNLYLVRCRSLFVPRISVPLLILPLITYLASGDQGLHDNVILGYPFVILMAALFLGRHAAIGFGTLSYGAIILLYWLEQTGRISSISSAATEWTDLLDFLLMISAIVALLWAIMTSMSRVTQRARKSEEEMRQSRNMLAHVLNAVPQSVCWKDAEGLILGCNENFASMLRQPSPQAVAGKSEADFPEFCEHADAHRGDDLEVMRLNQPKRYVVESYTFSGGSSVWMETSRVPLVNEAGQVFGVLGVFDDVTDRKRSEEERALLQDQLLHAQKMESVGRLAGGVAHDFNNMLSVILGRSELLLDTLDASHPIRNELLEINLAAKRSADLTRQLLAFARKQVVKPQMLNLNETVSGMLKMLQRLIGEDIELVCLPRPELWHVMMDPSQVDQILVNLCVNARDAIDNVGRISIEMENSEIDPEYCLAHAGYLPGQYVKLVVSDNGHGMERETLAHLFEPFFTTKRIGKGTGLGLATVYGIVKQNRGFIHCYSEADKGTTFSVYLPRHISETETVPALEVAPETPTLGQETVLLVEDEPAILRMAVSMLDSLGYRVLPALGPAEALRVAQEFDGPIHLLITDVVMPGMNGHDLVRELVAIRPDLKQLFMSGYTSDVIVHHGVLDEGVNFLQKPFSPHQLAAHVRAALSA